MRDLDQAVAMRLYGGNQFSERQCTALGYIDIGYLDVEGTLVLNCGWSSAVLHHNENYEVR
jgi:hypothetical protein